MPAKAEAVVERIFDSARSWCVRCYIKINQWIKIIKIDGRRHNLVLHGKQAGDRLNYSGSAEQVASHRFCCTDVELVGVLTKNGLDCSNFCNITEWGGGAVGIDIIDFFGRNSRHGECCSHGIDCSYAFRMWRSQVIGVGGCSYTDDFSVDFGATGFC